MPTYKLLTRIESVEDPREIQEIEFAFLSEIRIKKDELEFYREPKAITQAQYFPSNETFNAWDFESREEFLNDINRKLITEACLESEEMICVDYITRFPEHSIPKEKDYKSSTLFIKCLSSRNRKLTISLPDDLSATPFKKISMDSESFHFIPASIIDAVSNRVYFGSHEIFKENMVCDSDRVGEHSYPTEQFLRVFELNKAQLKKLESMESYTRQSIVKEQDDTIRALSNFENEMQTKLARIFNVNDTDRGLILNKEQNKLTQKIALKSKFNSAVDQFMKELLKEYKVDSSQYAIACQYIKNIAEIVPNLIDSTPEVNPELCESLMSKIKITAKEEFKALKAEEDKEKIFSLIRNVLMIIFLPIGQVFATYSWATSEYFFFYPTSSEPLDKLSTQLSQNFDA